MNKQLAFGMLEVKSVDEAKREISGMASTPEPDRSGDIVEPLGAKFAAVIPFLWQHRHDMPIGEARLGKPTKAGIPFTAKIVKIDVPGLLKDYVDMAWQSIEAGLVRGVSIGFRPTVFDYMSEGGIRFREYEVIELSGATVPANASATIQSIKAWGGAQGLTDGSVRLLAAQRPLPVDLKGAVKLLRP
jgi:HK97 family phage prohead protease